MDEVIASDWTPRLASALASAILEFAPSLNGAAVSLLALDCHPWHGSVSLALLTAAEVAADPLLADPTEMAAWRHYSFSDRLVAWQPVAALGQEMQSAYGAAVNRAAVAEAFMASCASAATRPEVTAAVKKLVKAVGFRITITHPDDGREFVPGSTQVAEHLPMVRPWR